MTRIRLVLVDDSKLFLDALDFFLAQWGTVEIAGCAASGEEGLRLIESTRPDLVLMDIFMPVMNGLEASKRIGRTGVHPRILLMTGIEYPGLPQLALDANADGFILKHDIYSELPRRLAQWFPSSTIRGA